MLRPFSVRTSVFLHSVSFTISSMSSKKNSNKACEVNRTEKALSFKEVNHKQSWEASLPNKVVFLAFQKVYTLARHIYAFFSVLCIYLLSGKAQGIKMRSIITTNKKINRKGIKKYLSKLYVKVSGAVSS